MVSEGERAEGPFGTLTRSRPQQRILAAALDLIGSHGVSGTSLQMIADAVGVTKAAVYHQYRSKNDIVIAVTENELAILQDALLAAEADERPEEARRTLLIQLIDLAVTRRQWVGTLTSDPVIVRILGEHPPFLQFMRRLYGVLLDQRDDTKARVSAAIMSAAIAGSVVNPLVADVDDDVLRATLIELVPRLMGLDG
ncbi:TetR/AcrR family transcriptional regulator [Mycolicibacterium madagascariense]|uniref:TetR/AcrR family transcriptional regulator n=1 Tax=Mycolicibacterium madagascariense TaxID=212765 RepID=UPI001FE5DCC2|nr:TetR/AcrR family transcriptional regulator [Mycolicibacterium madagascariense]